MGREEQIQFEQDRLGNERKKLDQIRSLDGSDAGEENGGLVVISADQVGTEVIFYEPPKNVDEYYLSGLRAYNSGDSGGTFHLLEAEVDDNGNINSSDRRTVDLDMATGVTRTFGYEGGAFEDAITIVANFEGQVSLSVHLDNKEHTEPAAEDY